MRRCWSSGGRSNPSSLSVVQFIVGESDPTEISTARLMNRSLIIREWQKLRQQPIDGFGPHDHRVRRANSIHVRHGEFALIGTAPSENYVALAEA